MHACAGERCCIPKLVAFLWRARGGVRVTLVILLCKRQSSFIPALDHEWKPLMRITGLSDGFENSGLFVVAAAVLWIDHACFLFLFSCAGNVTRAGNRCVFGCVLIRRCCAERGDLPTNLMFSLLAGYVNIGVRARTIYGMMWAAEAAAVGGAGEEEGEKEKAPRIVPVDFTVWKVKYEGEVGKMCCGCNVQQYLIVV